MPWRVRFFEFISETAGEVKLSGKQVTHSISNILHFLKVREKEEFRVKGEVTDVSYWQVGLVMKLILSAL